MAPVDAYATGCEFQSFRCAIAASYDSLRVDLQLLEVN